MYFGSSESLGVLKCVGKEIRDEAGKAAWGRLGRALNARVRSFKFTMWPALFEVLS